MIFALRRPTKVGWAHLGYFVTLPDGVRAKDGDRRKAIFKQPAASRACRPKRSQDFRRRRSGACGPGCFWVP
ncbi:MAG: hypothetical protein ABSH32_25965 [Bryobacteraceae bacterium]